MASFMLVNRNPLTTPSTIHDTVTTFTLTDEYGNSNDITAVKYLWIPHPASISHSDVLAENMLSVLAERIIIYSDVNGFVILNRSSTVAPDLNIGFGNSWSRIEVTYIDSNFTGMWEGFYVMQSGATGKSVWNGTIDPDGVFVGGGCGRFLY